MRAEVALRPVVGPESLYYTTWSDPPDVTPPAIASADETAPDVSIVVPTYNERGGIAELVAAVFAVFRESGLRRRARDRRRQLA